jgi:outer membrane receptor protein involved in Fe transport
VGYYYRTQVKHDEVNKYTYNRQSILKNYYTRFRYDPEFEKQVNAKAYFEHKFAKEDHDIRMEFNTSRSDEAEDNHYRNVYQLPVLPASYDNTLIKPADTENQLTIDYTYPVSESAKLEAGYDGSFNKNDFNFYGEWYDTIQKHFIKDLQKSNEFIYKEMIHAIYFTWQKSMGAFGYEAGLRGEQVNIKGTLVTLDSLIKNNYIKIYPTLHLSYKINTLNEIQLNYSRRVNRPDPEQLNPFPEYRDPRNLQAGNAKLLPETINSVEFGYKWQKKNISFVPGIYYRNKTNGFTQVIKKLNDSTLLTTAANLANDRSAGLELIFSVKSGKLFNANMSSNIFYNQIDASNIGYTQTKSIISFNSTINATCNFAENTMFQASSNYRSARLTPQGKIAPSIVVNAGFRQDLYKKKITLTLTVSDIFASLKEKRDLNTLYLKQTTTGTRDARIFYLGVSYRFGKTIKVPKEEKLQFDNGG